MPARRLSPEAMQKAVDLVATYDGNLSAAARASGIDRKTLEHRVTKAGAAGIVAGRTKPFEVDALPDELPPIDELLARRKRQYERKHVAAEARKLIPVRIKTPGPIGIVHFGDPHVDDDGCDISLLERHVEIVNKTEGLFGANLGDMQNNWVGRLSHLWGQQSTSAAEAWALTEWLVRSVQWLYLVGGNHDCWSGSGDPLKWMMADQVGVYQNHGARLELQFPNKRKVRVNARHDFAGHSMWNPAHGPMKAVQFGWRDHILTCGHKHTSFSAGPLKCPATGLLSHTIRCAGYKIHDRFADERGFQDQNASPAIVTVIDPQYDETSARMITVINDVEEGAEFLKYKRRKAA